MLLKLKKLKKMCYLLLVTLLLEVLLTLFRLGFFGQSVTGGGAPRTPPLYLWNQ